MANPGVAPVDPSTEIGQLRYLIGDTAYTELQPPVTDQGDYTWFSDVALQVFIDRAGGNLDLAAAYAFRQIGDYYAQNAASIKTDDLQVSERWRIAQMFYDRADQTEGNANADIFVLASMGCGCSCHAELAERPWCWACSCH